MKPLLVALLLALGLWAYAPAWSAGWVMEDEVWASGRASGEIELLSPQGLTAWTWRLTSTPLAAHLTSLVLHGLVVILAGLYAWRLGLPPLVAWIASVFLLVHPLSVETVMYASNRNEQIAALGVLGACLAATLTTQWKWSLIGACLVLGVLGKEFAAVALGVVPLTLWMTHQRWGIAAGVGAFLVAGVVWQYGGPYALTNFADFATEISAGEWLRMQATAVFRITLTLVTAYGMTPDFDYDRVSTATQAASLCWLVGLGLLAWRCRTQARVVTFSLVWLLITIAPRLVIQTPASYLNEPHFYLSLIGLLIGAAAFVIEGPHAIGVWFTQRQLVPRYRVT